MNQKDSAPRQLKKLLLLSIAGTVISISCILWVYLITSNTVQVVGRDTVPQIIAARYIKATLANAHSNAMNAMVTNEKLGGYFWNLHDKDLYTLQSQLVDASNNMKYVDEEREPLLSIAYNINNYQFTVGGAVADGAEISVDQFMEANRLMQQKILPASSALDKANLSKLNSAYDSYRKQISGMIGLIVLVGFAFLVMLIFIQYKLFQKTNRVFNLGFLVATILFSINLIYFVHTLNSVKAELIFAKEYAFDSLNALWNAKAVAYNAKSTESLYLLHNGTGIVQTADTINFNLYSQRIFNDAKSDSNDSKFEGYLNEALENATLSEEKEGIMEAIKQWTKYVETDKQVRSLEYDSMHNEAIALSVGNNDGQANHEFSKFDSVIEKLINISQLNFEDKVASINNKLDVIPFVLIAFLAVIISALTLGMKPRIEEYR